MIPYKFCILDVYPQHIVLAYKPKDTMVREFIRIKPKGYQFHDITHSSISQLIAYFKKEFKSTEYRRKAKSQRSPRATNSSVTTLSANMTAGGDWQNTGDKWD
jgi:Lhr-like helicase